MDADVNLTDPDMAVMSLCMVKRVRCDVDSGNMNMAQPKDTAIDAAAGSMRTFGSVPLNVGKRGPSVNQMSLMIQANIAVKASFGTLRRSRACKALVFRRPV